jgi:hypothetical protein
MFKEANPFVSNRANGSEPPAITLSNLPASTNRAACIIELAPEEQAVEIVLM